MVRLLYEGHGLEVHEIFSGNAAAVVRFTIGGLEARAMMELPAKVATVALEQVLERIKRER
jgi:hypothetical protein